MPVDCFGIMEKPRAALYKFNEEYLDGNSISAEGCRYLAKAKC